MYIYIYIYLQEPYRCLTGAKQIAKSMARLAKAELENLELSPLARLPGFLHGHEELQRAYAI